MAVKIKFDSEYNAEKPTFVLANKSGEKLGILPAYDIQFKAVMTSGNELSFKVNKSFNNGDYPYWDVLKDFKLVWCKEWDIWFEIRVELTEDDDTIKSVIGKSIGEAELSQINIYDLEINTESDIEREDYKPSVLYDVSNVKASVLHRVLEKAPHYSIKHVDESISNIERTYSFNDTSIYNALMEISEETDCLVVINSGTDTNGKIERSISLYDLESYCLNCNHRGNFIDKCPECGGTDILSGYGNDTNIFISSELLADDIKYAVDVDSVKNCFKLDAGDEAMNEAIKNCNPNGSCYLWYISDSIKEDMTDDLIVKLAEYDNDYDYYNKEYVTTISDSILKKYNQLIDKYIKYDNSLSKLDSNIVGYNNLMKANYYATDFYTLLSNTLKPEYIIKDTTAAAQASLLKARSLSPIALNSIDNVSVSSLNNSILAMAKLLIDSHYSIEVDTINATYNETTHIWNGRFIVTNKTDETDTAESNYINIAVNDNYQTYIEQEIDKQLFKENENINNIVSIFHMDISTFTEKLKEYGLDTLNLFRDNCEGIINMLIEENVSDKSSSYYLTVYLPYYMKLSAINAEITLRENEIAVIMGVHNNFTPEKTGIIDILNNSANSVHKALDFQSYFGSDLWLELCAFRREDTYSNSNYASDGLNNAEIYKYAMEFLNTAKKEIYKSATLQHSISATLKNLLVLEQFKPIVNSFEIGNWIRLKVDGELYRLRLIDYELDYNNLDNIKITFSDVKNVDDGFSDVESIISSAQNMATTYGYVTRQAGQGQSGNEKLKNWVDDGLALTQVKIINNADNQNVKLDRNGMLFRKYNNDLEEYEDEQLKIVNSTIAITNDNWKSTKTAIGKFYYRDLLNGGLYTPGYGVNAETIVGRLILGQELGIYNYSDNGALNMSFNQNGLNVTNGINTVNINPADNSIFTIKKNTGNKNLLSFTSSGTLNIGDKLTFDGTTLSVNGTINSNKGTIGGFTISDSGINSSVANIYSYYSGQGRIELSHSSNKQHSMLCNWGLTIDDDKYNNSTNDVYLGFARDDTNGYISELQLVTPSKQVSQESTIITSGGNAVFTAATNKSVTIQDGNIYMTHDLNAGGEITSDKRITLSRSNTNAEIYCGTDGKTSSGSYRSSMVTVSNSAHDGYLLCSSSGNFGVYSTSFGQWLIRCNTSGDVISAASSDRRAKDNIIPMPTDEAYSILKQTEIVNHTYKTDKNGIIHNGIIAQNLRDVLINNDIGYRPYLIIESNGGEDNQYTDLTHNENEVKYSIDYRQFTPILWKGWQYHDEEIIKLKETIKEQNNTIESLKLRLEKLEKN